MTVICMFLKCSWSLSVRIVGKEFSVKFSQAFLQTCVKVQGVWSNVKDYFVLKELMFLKSLYPI